MYQTLKRGAFGCPQPKEAFGFPEEAPSVVSLDQAITETAQNSEGEATDNDPFALGALALSALACVLAVSAIRRK